jgi:hypothetical protein
VTDLLRDALQQVRDGAHASSVLERLFREHDPTEAQAAAWRRALHDAIRAEGIPPWLADMLRRDWGSRATSITTSLQHDAPTYIRVNTIRTTVDDVVRALADHVPVRCDLPEALRIDRPFGLFRAAAFQGGWFEQQDLASQRVAPALDVRPGMRVIDACAGSGGKSRGGREPTCLMPVRCARRRRHHRDAAYRHHKGHQASCRHGRSCAHRCPLFGNRRSAKESGHPMAFDRSHGAGTA